MLDQERLDMSTGRNPTAVEMMKLTKTGFVVFILVYKDLIKLFVASWG